MAYCHFPPHAITILMNTQQLNNTYFLSVLKGGANRQNAYCNGEKVKSRKKTHNKWFETQDSISYWEDFFKPKIIYPNMTKYMPFAYDNQGYLTNQKCFIMTGVHLPYLTAFFNSNIFKICYRDCFPELQGGTRELSKIFFENIRIPQIDKLIEYDIENMLEDAQ